MTPIGLACQLLSLAGMTSVFGRPQPRWTASANRIGPWWRVRARHRAHRSLENLRAPRHSDSLRHRSERRVDCRRRVCQRRAPRRNRQRGLLHAVRRRGALESQPHGFVVSKRMTPFLRRLLKHHRFEEMPILLGVVATDLCAGEPVSFRDTGDVFLPIRASCSTPVCSSRTHGRPCAGGRRNEHRDSRHAGP